eukprot:TRINITY_DN5626_c0_g1_i1.p1 TRINITY_DN5626_c0_g1~~TRINITY_DN5626_c0_g1_i1.p1  ORF type:complete len:343 (-),score=53.56 TRINITY_DN5626_c0_g1_i1:65-1093(-)
MAKIRRKNDILPTITTDQNEEYRCVSVVGEGTFGVVYQAYLNDQTTSVAIKRVELDPRYKNRELQIMLMLDHLNTCKLLHHFFENKRDKVILNLILEYIPKDLADVCLKYTLEKMPLVHTKLYIYQLCRGLAYMHSLGICHRDIKPHNLLIDPETHMLKICDFGSAKIILEGKDNVAYICSRFYRAPELLFEATRYTTAIDIWSAGCVLGELILGELLFAGENEIQQMHKVIRVLGSPTNEQLEAMNPDYEQSWSIPEITSYPWEKVFPSDTPPMVIELISLMLVYKPLERIPPLAACAHPVFDELRDRVSEFGDLHLFEFTDTEKQLAEEMQILSALLPDS